MPWPNNLKLFERIRSIRSSSENERAPNGSLAIWYHWAPAKKGQSPRAAVDVHVNLWRLRVRKRSTEEETFLDIGLRLSDISSIADFKIYLPFRLDHAHDIVDLGKILEDRTTLMAVFNEAYFPGDPDAAGTFSISGAGGKEVLCCHALRPGIDFTLAARNYGTIVHFNAELCSRFRSNSGQYIRFRIMLKGARGQAFSRMERQYDRFLLSSKPRDEVVEFRLNEQRSLPHDIGDEMTSTDNYELFRITSIHYFLIRESDSQCVLYHSDFHKVRLLEDILWSKYLTGTRAGALRHDSFIYHWRRIAAPNDDLGDFHALAKFRRLITGWPTIMFYLVVIFAIGISGNLLASWFWEHWLSAKPAPAASATPPGRGQP
jgi:hypothetical protein